MKKICIISAVILFLSVSCASVPKTQSSPESTQKPQNEEKPEVESVPREQAIAAEKQQTETNGDYSSLSEPVVPDILPDSVSIQSLPEQNAIPPVDKIEEPSVYDEPYTEKKTIPGTNISTGSVNASAPAQKAEQKPVPEPKVTSANTDEITPVKHAADIQQDSSAAPAEIHPKTVSVPKKKSAAPSAKSGKVPVPDNSETAVADKTEKIVPSRSVTLDKNQYLDVKYPGTGWIYLGETNGTKNMIFFGRKLGEIDTSFTLRARNTGRSILHFYKNDVLTGKYIDDYLEVNVTGKDTSTQEHVSAPLYADLVPPHPSSTAVDSSDNSSGVRSDSSETPSLKTKEPDLSTETTANLRSQNAEKATANMPSSEDAPVKTVIQTTESTPDSQSYPVSPAIISADSTSPVLQGETAAASTASTDLSGGKSVVLDEQTQNESSDNLLKDAQNAYNTKQYEKAQALLTLFFDKSATRIDEGLYLQGQVLEAKSSIQNIKGAVDSYEILMKNWPDSPLWQNARQRDIYLHRMYIDIR
jgi:hypothetical protein